ncbi:MAG: hypothetical protein IJM61_07495 [Firmicutes bacterium]|nr:hypothetical protein [Bacillota bacterium]
MGNRLFLGHLRLGSRIVLSGIGNVAVFVDFFLPAGELVGVLIVFRLGRIFIAGQFVIIGILGLTFFYGEIYRSVQNGLSVITAAAIISTP